MTFLDYINKQQTQKLNESQILEGFKLDDVDKANKLILNLMKKNCSGKCLLAPAPVANKVDGKDCLGVQFFRLDSKGKVLDMVLLNYLVSGSSANVYSIDFMDEDTASEFLFGSGETKTRLSIYTLGKSVVYFLPVIWYVLNTRDFDITNDKAKEVLGKTLTESRNFFVGALKYTIMENLTSDDINMAYHIECGSRMVFNESLNDYVWEARTTSGPDNEANRYKKQKYDELKAANAKRGDSEDARRNAIELNKEYEEIKKAIKGGATTIAEIKMSMKKDVKIVNTNVEPAVESKFNKMISEKTPEQNFKEMAQYVKMVIKGLSNAVILCGAPGVGKTYKVMRQLKAAGYTNGSNMGVIKGKCSPRQLYAMLYTYQNKGDILVIDDADGLVGPKAPEDCINILKGALDSSSEDEGRLVSYRTTVDVKDDYGQAIPKEFYYRGGCIVITNYNIGQIDTALRSRSYIKDLNFSVEQVLEMIKKLIPEMGKDKGISMASKMKAYNLLVEMSKDSSVDIQVSMRNFNSAATLYETIADDPDYTDEEADNMVIENMINAARRGGSKY